MKIKNKITGEIVEITDPKQLAKYGLSVPKAQTGKIIKGKKANNTYNNNYEDVFNNRNPNQISFTPRDEGQEPNVIDLYQPPQSYMQGMNSVRPQEESMTIPTLSELQPNLSLDQNPYTTETIKNYSEKPISKPTFKPSPNLYPVTTNKYFDRALRYNQNATNFAFDAINNLATGEKSNRSNVSYNGNLGIPQQNIDINYNKVNSPKTEKYFAQSGLQLPENENSMINMLNFRVRPQEQFSELSPLQTNLETSNQKLDFNSLGYAQDKTNSFDPSTLNPSSNPAYNTLNFIGTGVNNTLTGINMGKGILDMVGNNRQNKMEQKRNAEQFTQSVFNSEEFSTPYESRGYGFQGRNALAENGMQIKDIGGYGQPNIEAEKGEMVKTPEGFAQTLQGKTHEEGGIPLNLQPETKIFSDHLKDPITKKTYSKLAKPFETKKDFDRMNSKKGDDIQKKTSELMISFKNQKLDELFDIQEMDKISGKHGAKIQLETIQNQQPMTKYGMELPKAQTGYKTLTPDVKQKARKVDAPISDYSFIDKDGNRTYYGKESSKTIPPVKDNYKGAKMSNEDWKKFLASPQGKKYKEKYITGTTVENEEDYIYTEPKQLLNPQTPQDTKIEYIDRIKNQYLQPNIEANMNIPTYLPNNYGRLPLNFYDLNPEFIDPRYLDIQPQLNQVSRGQRAFQNNLGSRTSSDMSNLLQSQVNAYNQNQNIYGQKYNYDRQQDATAQQFNAQAVMNTDQYNQSAWYNQLEDPIRRRDGALSTQELKDSITSQENASNSTAYYNNLDYIQNEVPYYNKLNKDQIVEALDLYIKQQDPYKTTKKTTTKKTEEGTEKTEVVKYGGKVKIKPKIKKK